MSHLMHYFYKYYILSIINEKSRNIINIKLMKTAIIINY